MSCSVEIFCLLLFLFLVKTFFELDVIFGDPLTCLFNCTIAKARYPRNTQTTKQACIYLKNVVKGGVVNETVVGVGADLHLEVVDPERRRGRGVSSWSPGPLRMRRLRMMMMRRIVRALVKKMLNLKQEKRGRRATLDMEKTMHNREIVDTLTRTTVPRFQTSKMTRETGVETVRRILLLSPPPQRRRIILCIVLL